MRSLTAGEAEALRAVSYALAVEPSDLAQLIQHESRWDPQARPLRPDGTPLSSARGLLQWLDRTAHGLGYSGPDARRPWRGASLDLVTRHPTAEAQLRGPVLEYLRRQAPFEDEPPRLPGQSLFLAVFYPRARRWDPDRLFAAAMTADQGRRFAEANPGIHTPRDYVERVRRSR